MANNFFFEILEKMYNLKIDRMTLEENTAMKDDYIDED